MTLELQARFSKRYPSDALIESDFTIPADRFSVLVLFGPSGSGKTTVLRCIAGLERPDSGSISFGNDAWFACERGVCLPPQQRDVGYLSQDYALFPHLSVAKNITYGLNGSPPRARIDRMTMLLKMLGLVNLEDRYPRELSGGEQQRVALARAVARRPRLLLLDEPLSALDTPTREQLRRDLRHWLAEMAVPTIIVTHDMEEAKTLGDTAVVMERGKMVRTGPALDALVVGSK